MLIKLFKNSQPLALFILPLISLILGLSYLNFNNFSIVDSGMPFYLIFKGILAINKFMISLVVVTLITTQAYHFNRILQKHEMLYKNSFLPLLFYVLTCSLIPQFWSFHPLLFVNSILLFVLDKTFALYKSEEPVSKSFDISFLIAVTTFFYLPAIVLIFFYLVTLVVLRPFSWREWIAGAMGFAVPFFLVSVFYFITDRLPELRNLFNIDIWKNSFDFKNITLMGFRVTVVFTLLLFLLSALKLRANFFKNVIRTRRFQQTIFIFLFFSIISVLISTEAMVFRFFIICIPLGFFFSYYFLAIRKNWFSELLFWVFVIILVNNLIG